MKCVYVWGTSHAKGGPGKPAVWPSQGQMEWQMCGVSPTYIRKIAVLSTYTTFEDMLATLWVYCSLCVYYEQSTNHISLGKKVIQSHPLHSTRFGQYQASSALRGDREMGTAIQKVGRSSSKASFLCTAIFRSKIVAILIVACYQCGGTGSTMTLFFDTWKLIQ